LILILSQTTYIDLGKNNGVTGGTIFDYVDTFVQHGSVGIFGRISMVAMLHLRSREAATQAASS
jgi:hypothetical protein